MNLLQKPLDDDQYCHDVFPKDLLVLHFTAGSTAAGALQSWAASPERVATAYIVDVDGSVIQTFPAEKWAYHLGQKETNANDKRSVAIEVVNVGPLRKVGDDLNWWPENFTTKYCGLGTDGDKYLELKQPWRGFLYFARFSEAQAAALAELVPQVCHEHKIPLVLPPVQNRLSYDLPFFNKWKGIASHQNFRADKTDVGPAFPWEAIAKGLTS